MGRELLEKWLNIRKAIKNILNSMRNFKNKDNFILAFGATKVPQITKVSSGSMMPKRIFKGNANFKP
jgi:hypothetical protein